MYNTFGCMWMFGKKRIMLWSIPKNGKHADNKLPLTRSQKAIGATHTSHHNVKRSLAVNVIALMVIVLVPYLHLGVIQSFWETPGPAVNRSTCECPCWDRKFKGSYEIDIPRYKHVYFNLTSNTFKIWTLTISAAVALYELVRYTLRLWLNNSLRCTMAFIIAASFYNNYYAWWMYWGYWNDDFYAQWWHQMYFTITEMTSTLVAVYLLDRQRAVKSGHMTVILTISLTHILASGADQFFTHVFFGTEEQFQLFRDIGLMFGDVINFIVSLYHIIHTRGSRIRSNRLVMVAYLLRVILFGVGSLLILHVCDYFDSFYYSQDFEDIMDLTAPPPALPPLPPLPPPPQPRSVRRL